MARLICWDAGFAHLIFAHGGAIVLLAALDATFVERVRSQRRVSSSSKRIASSA